MHRRMLLSLSVYAEEPAPTACVTAAVRHPNGASATQIVLSLVWWTQGQGVSWARHARTHSTHMRDRMRPPCMQVGQADAGRGQGRGQGEPGLGRAGARLEQGDEEGPGLGRVRKQGARVGAGGLWWLRSRLPCRLGVVDAGRGGGEGRGKPWRWRPQAGVEGCCRLRPRSACGPGVTVAVCTPRTTCRTASRCVAGGGRWVALQAGGRCGVDVPVTHLPASCPRADPHGSFLCQEFLNPPVCFITGAKGPRSCAYALWVEIEASLESWHGRPH